MVWDFGFRVKGLATGVQGSSGGCSDQALKPSPLRLTLSLPLPHLPIIHLNCRYAPRHVQRDIACHS